MKNIIKYLIVGLILSPLIAGAVAPFVFTTSQGGTGISTTPAVDEILVGNAGGTYTLTPLSTLTADGFSTTSADYYIHSSTTIPKTYTANTFTAQQTMDMLTVTTVATTSKLCFGNTPDTCMTAPVVSGAGITLYPWNMTEDIATYEGLRTLPDTLAEVDESCAATSGYCASVLDNYVSTTTITATGPLILNKIPAGTWTFDIYTYVSNAANTSVLEFTMIRRTSLGVETDLFQATSTDINNTTVGLMSFASTQATDFAFDPTDRLVIRVKGWTDSGAAKTIHWVYEDGTNYSHVDTPITIASEAVAFLPANNIFTGSNSFTGSNNYFSNPVGIGTTTPVYKLDVFGTNASKGIRLDSNAAKSPYLTLKSSTGKSSIYQDGTSLLFGIGDPDSITPFLYMTSGAKFGINTSGPLSMLDVGGNMAIGSYAGANAAPSNGLIVSGQTAIGTASPSGTSALTVSGTTTTTNLHVTGDAKIDGLLYAPVSLTTSGDATINGVLTATYFTANSTAIASTFPYASTTSMTVSSSLYITPLSSALILTGADGLMSEYAGTSCTNQFTRSISALGVATCASVANTDLTNSTIGLTTSGSLTIGTSPISLGGTSALNLNMSNANSWTALQTFVNASTTNIGSTGSAYFATAGGNVGIGTTTPFGHLDLYTDAGGTITTLNINGQNGSVGDTSSRIMMGIVESGVTMSDVELRAVRSVYDSGHATDFAVAVAGSERLRIAKNGNVGIGTTNPGAKLHIDGDLFMNAYAARVVSGITPKFYLEGANYSDAGLGIVSNGNNTVGTFLLIGKSRGGVVGGTTIVQNGDGLGGMIMSGSDGTSLASAAAIVAEVDGTPGAGDMPGRLVFQTSNDGAAVNTEKMRITNEGNVGIGTTSPWRKLSVTGTVAFDGLTVATGGNAVCIAANKDIQDAGNTTCVTSSRRFKNTIEALSNDSGLKEILKMNPVSFKFNKDYRPADQVTHVGLIAEEVAKLDTRLTTYDNEGKINGVDYSGLSANIIKAIQQLSAKVDAQEIEIENLKHGQCN